MENTESVRWSALEYPHRKKTADWYWVLGILAVAGAVAAFILGNILFSLLIVVGAFTVALFAARHPRIVEFEIDQRGVRADIILYPYSSLISFWILEGTEEQKILLRSSKKFMPYIIIPLGDIHPLQAHEFLIERLPEEEIAEPLSHRIMDYLRF